MALKQKLKLHLKKGALHKDMGVPEGKKLTHEQKEEAANSDNPKIAKRGQFALNAEKWHH